MPNGLRLSVLFLAALAAAQQQPPYGQDHRSSPQENSALRPHTQLIPTSIDHDYKKRKDTLPHISKNERAVATYAPAELNTAVRARSARSAAGPNRGLSTRARSLQDWEVTDFVLLATIDGSIYARDRQTGKERWKFYSEKPMVETLYSDRTTLSQPGNQPGKDFVFSVEPTNGGILYMYMPGPNPELQKLGITVRQLAEDLSPYSDDASNFVYTAEKKNTLLTLNATNGAVIKFFGPGGSGIVDTSSCRPFNGLEMEDDECEPTPTINLGRTDYTVSIQDRSSGEDVCIIRLFEWTSNNRDRDLSQQYAATMDGKYIYSRYDGSINALKHDKRSDAGDSKPLYKQKLGSPVVRVFDVIRPQNSDDGDTALVLLPQPVPPTRAPEIDQQVFINCTDSGTWYALSELNYPTVTDGAIKAKVYGRPVVDDFGDDHPFELIPEELVGVHSLSDGALGEPHAMIEGPQQHLPIVHTDDELGLNETLAGTIDPPKLWFAILSRLSADVVAKPASALAIALILFMALYLRPHILKSYSATKEAVVLLEQTSAEPAATPEVKMEDKPITPKMVKFDSVIEAEITADDGELSQRLSAENQADDDATALVDGEAGDGAADGGADDLDADGQKKKKKTHRGQRGGRKRKPKGKGDKNDKELADEEIERPVEDLAVKPPIQATPDQEKERVLVINSMEELTQDVMIDRLVVYKDRVLGLGSGGTVVYEGKFEGRDVAVKRMLQQYFDVASQEVSLLQQSDDHPNVIRYFCHQKTADFLYIAVERCQASLWDLYKEGGARDGLKDDQMSLLTATNSNVQNSLYQIAAGLHHLHGLRIIHRDIKPQNILIAYPRPNQKNLRFVISDFGLCRTLPKDVSTLIGTVGANAGTVGWKAPELIGRPDPSTSDPNGPQSSTDKQGNSKDGSSQSSNADTGAGVKRAVDIFSLGCVFFYVLTNGGHPFDSKDEHEIWHAQREMNIKKGLMNLDKLKGLGEDESSEAIHLIQWMLEHKAENRPTAAQVLNHPFFWSPQKRLNFLCDVSDHFEREPRGPPFSVEPMSDSLWLLEERGAEIHGGDFLKRLDKSFIDTLGKQRKYSGNRLLDLLRGLRNKKNHWADMPEPVKVRVGELPEGYLRYWTHRFPRLLMVCWEVVTELGLESDARFRGYLTEEGS